MDLLHRVSSSCVVLLCWSFLSVLCFRGHYAATPDLSVKFLKAPPQPLSNLKSFTFVFQILESGNGVCTSCTASCKLDGGSFSDCGTRKACLPDLEDGNHTFEVCTNASQSAAVCSSYNWTVDTKPPTAQITAWIPFTNASQSAGCTNAPQSAGCTRYKWTVAPRAEVTAWTPFNNSLNVSVHISFSKPCAGGGGFQCSSENACNLLVYGHGHVIPSTLVALPDNLTYSLVVGLSPNIPYGRVILVMDKNFCTDAAGNMFTRSTNSNFNLRFDRRNVSVDMTTPIIPEKLLPINGTRRLVRATNNYENLKVYLYFSVPVLNSPMQILNSMKTSHGNLIPLSGENRGNRKFGFMVANISSIAAIVKISQDSSSIKSIQGTPVSPIAPVTFLYVA